MNNKRLFSSIRLMLSIAVLDLAGIIQLAKSAEKSPANTSQSTSHSAVNSNLLNKAASSLATMTMAPSTKRAKKPNIVIIWGDDIGQSNISAYSMGMMGYRTPNIDRVAKEGMIFTDYYAEQSCTAGRASFLTGHGFDEFYGNLYHLNAEEEPEHADYPKDPAFRARYGPRGVLETKASDVDDPTVDPRFGRVGKQTIKDTGPLTRKRMETVDGDIANRSVNYIKSHASADKPFFLWVNFTHMHFRTYIEEQKKGQAGKWLGTYADAMVEHDKNVGEVLKALEDAGIDDNTFVMYSTDNGPHMNSWPDAAMTPFRSEKNSNWEGAYRVPAMVRWPGHIKPGSVSNSIVSHHDWLPTLASIAGDSSVKEKLLKGHTIGEETYKVHLDGYDLAPYLTGQAKENPRSSFIYCNDDQQVTGLRFDNWKMVFMEQRAQGTLKIWAEPFVTLRVPKLFNLRSDPYERADVTSNTYYDWLIDHAFLFVPAQEYVGSFLTTFKDYPQRQKAASFNLDEVLKNLQERGGASQ